MTVRSVPLNLAPTQSFDLTVWSGDGDRFTKQFTEAWCQIPEPVRARILDHWTNGTYVLIELSNIWRNHSTRLGQAEHLGYEVKFNAEEFDRMPDSVAQCVIAHELAHVYQWATNSIKGTYEDEEGADNFVRSWGFDWIVGLRWRAQCFPHARG